MAPTRQHLEARRMEARRMGYGSPYDGPPKSHEESIARDKAFKRRDRRQGWINMGLLGLYVIVVIWGLLNGLQGGGPGAMYQMDDWTGPEWDLYQDR